MNKQDFYKDQNKKLSARTQEQVKLDLDSVHNILRKLQGK